MLPHEEFELNYVKHSDKAMKNREKKNY